MMSAVAEHVARACDRLQRQKLRRPNEQAEPLVQIAEELAKLATEEDEVAKAIGAGNNPDGKGGNPMDPMAKPKPRAHMLKRPSDPSARVEMAMRMRGLEPPRA